MTAATYFDQLQQLYISYFGRPGDPTGVSYWATRVDAANGGVAEVIAGFSASDESRTLYGGVNNSDKISAIYLNLFSRTPESAGLAYWVTQLDNGSLTQAEAAYRIQSSAGAGDAQAVANKLAIAKAFTAQIDTTAEIKAYAGANASGYARLYLYKVDSTSASVLTAMSGLADAVTQATSPATSSPGSRTFTLTTGIDNFFGGDGDDTVIGDESTYRVGDTYYGGAGIDALTLTYGILPGNLPGSFPNVEVLNMTAISGSLSVGATDLRTVNLTTTGSALTTLEGGRVVSLTSNGPISYTGVGAISVTVVGSSGVTIVHPGDLAFGVTLDHVSAPSVLITADATLNSLTVKNQLSSLALDLSSAAATNLAVNLQGAGYTAEGSSASVSINAGTITKNMVFNTSGTKSSATLAGNSLENIVITGSSALSLDVTAQGGSGVSKLTSIDATAATDNLTITTHAATSLGGQTAMTIKGGSGNDLILVATSSLSGSSAMSVTMGAGTDTVDVTSATLGSTTNKQITVITDFNWAKDSVKFVAGTTFKAAEVNVTAANNLDAALTTALSTNDTLQWFKYGGDTYLVDNNTIAGLDAGDVVVKLTGVVELGSAVISSAGLLSASA